MFILPIAAFVFVFLVIIQLIVVKMATKIMIKDFPDEFNEVKENSWPNKLRSQDDGMRIFLSSRGDKVLGSPKLTRLAKICTLVNWLIYGVWIVVACGVFASIQEGRIVNAGKEFGPRGVEILKNDE